MSAFDIAIFIYQCITQLKLEKLFFEVYGNYNKNPQPDHMKSIGDSSPLSPKCDTFIKFLPSRFRGLY